MDTDVSNTKLRYVNQGAKVFVGSLHLAKSRPSRPLHRYTTYHLQQL
jgi:hypothetical protein